MKSDYVLLVDKNDRIIGKEEKIKAHRNALLHRAFTVVVMNKRNKFLFTRRSSKKMLWPNFWDCSVASHCKENESYEKAALRRLKEELNLTPESLKLISKFYYLARDKAGYEHEICALLLAKCSDSINANPEEISELKWLNINKVEKLVARSNEIVPWFKIAFKKLKEKVKLK